jgi:hypothetical protein
MGEKENKAEKEDAVQKIRQIANQCLQDLSEENEDEDSKGMMNLR